jgi:hypothetical protein
MRIAARNDTFPFAHRTAQNFGPRTAFSDMAHDENNAAVAPAAGV